MKLFKPLLFGFFGGLLYAFISFFLLSQYLRNNIVVIFFIGIQGFLFAAIYLLLKKLIWRQSSLKSNTALNVFIGSISGLLSGCPNNAVTYHNAFSGFSGVVASEVIKSVVNELIYYSLGCVLLGSIIGLIISRWNDGSNP